MNKENIDLLEKANIARRVAFILAENIYAYLGGVISKEDLKNLVDKLMRDDYIKLFTHKYLLKDTYEGLTPSSYMEDLEANIDAYDLDELIIIEGDESDGRAEKTISNT